MNLIKKMVGLATLAIGSAAVSGAYAQDAAKYPQKPVHFIVAASAGGPSDVVARMVADKLSTRLGQPVIVENRPGGGMVLGTSAVARAAPDGYTMLFTTSTPIVMTPFTRKDLPYDVKKDFRIVAHVGVTPLVMYVNAGTDIKNMKDLADAARAKPGAVPYGSYGVGSSAHVLTEYFSRQQDIKMIHVPYKGVSPQVQELAGGQITAAVADIGVPAGLVEAGRIRPIAVTGDKRSSALPDVPTFAEQGVKGMEPFSPWWGVFAPVQTPDAIVQRVSKEIVEIVADPDIQKRMRELGIEPTGVGQKEAAERLDDELQRWEGIIGSLSDISFE